jgi:hypothetical protein
MLFHINIISPFNYLFLTAKAPGFHALVPQQAGKAQRKGKGGVV